MEDSTPQNLTLGVMFCVESDLEIDDTQFLHRDPDKYDIVYEAKNINLLLC